MIRITDLTRQYAKLADELQREITAVCHSGLFIKGPVLADFETQIAQYLQTPFALGVNSGTDALVLALKAAEIGPGDEVITTAMTFIATAEAISLTGATPVFVDIETGTECLKAKDLGKVLTPRTRAILPVHLHGYPCDMQNILAFARTHKLIVIEDCAQSIGALYEGRATGTLGDIGCFSFFPTKNLGAFGDGGLVVTANPVYQHRLRCLREHGSEIKNIQQMLGFNSRLDAIQAAILRVKLPYLNQWNRERREHAAAYERLLAPLGLPIRRPPLEARTNTYSVFHHYPLRLEGSLRGQRDVLQALMYAQGIECLPYYPQAMHEQVLYKQDYQQGDFPEAEDCAANSLALPLFPELTPQEQAHIVEQLSLATAQITQTRGTYGP
jgi:dTDP-4-amino-4,6-dideoxygalactose transaminase